MPSQKQLRWSELRVGLTVLIASVTLFVLAFLMTGSGGLFVRKIKVKSYFDNAGGLREGAPVRLQGVDLGTVTGIHVVRDHPNTPVEVTMKISTRYAFDLHKDSLAALETAGVLGETFVDLDSSHAKGPALEAGDVLPTTVQPDMSDVMRASQTTLQNMQSLLTRADRILSFIESGQGSIGKVIYDDSLYKQVNSTVNDFSELVAKVSRGEGSLGKLFESDELYNKANASVEKLNALLDQINSGQGTAGKFVKDPALYKNLNETVIQARELVTDINSGKGAMGKFAKDEAFARKLDNTVSKLSELADKLNSGNGTAGKFINDPSLYNNLNSFVTDTRDLVKAFRQNPKEYLTIHMKIF